MIDFVRRPGHAARDVDEHTVRQYSVRGDVLGAGDGFASLPQFTGYHELLSGAQRGDTLEGPPRPRFRPSDAGVVFDNPLKLFISPVELVLFRKNISQCHGELVEKLHVERRIIAPLPRDGGFGPVGIAVAFFQFNVEKLQHHCGQVRVCETGEAGS